VHASAATAAAVSNAWGIQLIDDLLARGWGQG
jgi:hypothetical protein